MSSISMRATPNVHNTLIEPKHSVILRADSPGRYTARWRSDSVWSRRRKLLSKRGDVGSPDCRSNSGECKVRNNSDPKFRFGNRYGSDQQSDEAERLRQRQLTETGISDRRIQSEARWRHRVSSDTYNPVNNRHFWDHSLKTRSMVITSRNSVQTAPRRHQPPTAPPCVFPRLSRSAEGTSGYEIPTRYPRGQQRPTGLASGHFALKLRHKQIVEASRQREVTWPQLRRNRATQNPRREEESCRSAWNSTNYYDVTMQQRCSRQATEKCQDWFNTWIED